MKKLIAFAAFAAMTMSAQAATISWGLGADVYLMKAGEGYASAVIAYDDSAPEVDAAAYLALVYIGQNKTSFDIGDVTSASVVDSVSFAIDTDKSSYCDFDPYSKDTDVFAANGYSAGASFAVVWYDGKKFDYVYSVDDGAALNSGSDCVTTINDIDRGSGEVFVAASTGGAVLAVPEPSVAILGLLGLGMLLKRRRA